jgi:hypothetical protein
MINVIRKIWDEFFCYKKLYLQILDAIEEYCKENRGSSCSKMGKARLIESLEGKGYDPDKANCFINDLLGVGYLETASAAEEYDSIEKNLLVVSPKGRMFLEDYRLKKIEPPFATLCKFIKRNLSEVFSAIAVIISVVGLFIK